MNPFMKTIYSIILIIFISTSFYIPASAYVLSGSHILDIMIKRINAPKRLYVNQKLSFYYLPDVEAPVIDSTDPVEIIYNEILQYVFPTNFRSEIRSNETNKIHLFSNNETITIFDENIVSRSETEFDHYRDLLLFNDRIMLENQLKQLGIDLSISSLGRFQNKIVFILGAKYPDESVPQLWIDKESFRPIRWFIRMKTEYETNDFVELRYSGWKKHRRSWYPMKIEFLHNNNLIRMIKVDYVRINPSISEELFNISHFNTIYPPLTPDLVKTQEPEETDEIQQTINNFKKIFE